MKLKIIVALHKNYTVPKDDIYLPVQVGAFGKTDIGFTTDDTGDNISSKNSYYCELTGLYWAWKNLDIDYVGLVHYRRYLGIGKKNKTENKLFSKILTSYQADTLLSKYDVILPKQRNYYIESVYNHYCNTMYGETLDEAGIIIQKKYPKYYEEFNKLKKTKKLHAFNMFIMKKEILNDYCKWLFDILFELEKAIPPSNYTPFHARYLGRISERLLDVWIKTNNIRFKEIKIVNIEKINICKKVFSFLQAKFAGKKYEKSF